MPELPEVENVKRDLDSLLAARPEVVAVDVLTPQLRTPLDFEIGKNFCGDHLESIARRSKFILFGFKNGFLLNHLGMTGSWREFGAEGSLKHDHFSMTFSNGKKLVYHDPRRFGLIEWVPKKSLTSNKWLRHLGPEPFDKKIFSVDYLLRQLSGKKNTIKSALLDQHIVAGLGNIYVNESLFLSGLSPLRKSGRVKREEAALLVGNITKVLKKAIDSGGSTIRDYRRADGKSGDFQKLFKVYGRAGESCKTCGLGIKSKLIAGRSSFWCSQCQK